jgi:undecaprenyl-diphosphatase
LLGAVQGLTEFLPVSSSAHLALVRRFLRRDSLSPALDVALHVGTTAALLTARRGNLLTPIIALPRDLGRRRFRFSSSTAASREVLLAMAATVPGALAGAAAYRWWVSGGGRRTASPLMQLAGAAVLAGAELAARRRATLSPKIGVGQALVIGAAQAAALLPGVSRFGSTVAAGMLVGLDRDAAERFSLMLSAQVTFAAVVRTLPGLLRLRHEVGGAALAAGMAASYAGGIVGITLLRGVLRRYGVLPFVVYRLVLAAAVGLALRDERGPSPPTPRPPLRARGVLVNRG